MGAIEKSLKNPAIETYIPKGGALLAPMAGVTDLSFRAICKAMGCALTYTEMVSAKGLHYRNANTYSLVETHPAEIPCAVQMFGSDPDIMARMAELIEREYGDSIGLIDINMGCPAPKITRNGEGSALMRNIGLASDIIRSVAQAAHMPVTVKFRKGWDEQSINAVEFACMARDSGAAAVSVHGRTRAQFYHGQADWEIIAKVREAVDIPVIGNGDIFSARDAISMLRRTGCHAVMVARGAQGNPWIFRQITKLRDTGKDEDPPTAKERADMALHHARMTAARRGEAVAVREMRKHVAWYIKGVRGAARVRSLVNCACTLAELESILVQLTE